MDTQSLIAALGIACHDMSSVPRRHVAREIERAAWEAVSFAPTYDAQLAIRDGRIAVLCQVWPPNHNALHEAVHAVLGPDSFDDEGPLMAYEQAVAQALSGADYRAWRDCFAHYGLSTRDVGHDDDVFLCREWRSLVALAAGVGVLLPDGHPVFGLGPHHSLLEWARSQ